MYGFAETMEGKDHTKHKRAHTTNKNKSSISGCGGFSGWGGTTSAAKSGKPYGEGGGDTSSFPVRDLAYSPDRLLEGASGRAPHRAPAASEVEGGCEHLGELGVAVHACAGGTRGNAAQARSSGPEGTTTSETAGATSRTATSSVRHAAQEPTISFGTGKGCKKSKTGSLVYEVIDDDEHF